MSHEQFAELLGAYALDAVDADEARAVATHLEACPRCAAELAEHHEVAGVLAGSGGDAPRHLWDRIAAGATAPSPRDPAETGATAPPADARADRRGTGVVLPGPGLRPPAGRGTWVRRVTGAIAAAAAVLAVLAGIQVARLDTKVNNLAALREQQGLSQATQAALLDPSAQRIALSAHLGGAPTAELVLLPSGSAFLVNRHLAPLPTGQTYQLWAVGPGQPVSLGLLGNRPASVPLVLGAGTETTTLAITVEPAGGVAAPTRPPVAASAPVTS